jgi:2-hydroxymuconate-semialdehyde hydrolase
MVAPDESIPTPRHQTLVVHGREDRVIPLGGSYWLLDLVPAPHPHVFGRCGRWTRIEESDAFNDMALRFLADP